MLKIMLNIAISYQFCHELFCTNERCTRFDMILRQSKIQRIETFFVFYLLQTLSKNHFTIDFLI